MKYVVEHEYTLWMHKTGTIRIDAWVWVNQHYDDGEWINICDSSCREYAYLQDAYDDAHRHVEAVMAGIPDDEWTYGDVKHTIHDLRKG